MTVATTLVFSDYTADGSTTAFGLAAYCQTADQLEVLIDDVVQSDAGYVISGLRDPGGVTATFSTAPTSGTVRVRRVIPLTQGVDTQNNEVTYQQVFDDALDRQVMGLQQVAEQVSRAIQVAQGDTPITVPAAADRVDGEMLMWANGGTEIVGARAAVPASVNVSSYWSSVLALTTRTAVQRELAIVTISPFSAQFGSVGDGVTDDVVTNQLCMDYCATLASSGAWRVQMDMGGRASRHIASALRGKAGVEIVNGQGLFSTVAVSTSDYQPVFAWVIWEGTVASANTTNILETTILGSQAAVIDASGGLVAGDQVMVTHTPPQTNLTAGINSSTTTIPVTDTTGWPNVGVAMVDSERIAYVSKTPTSITARTTTGRGTLGSSAASHSNGARVSLWHSGWYWIAGNTPRIPAEMNYIEAAPRNLASGMRSVMLRHGHDFKYSPSLSAGLRKVTAVKNVGLRNFTLIGSTSQGRVGGYEVGYLARYVDGFRSIDCAVLYCADKHGWLDSTVNWKIDKQFMLGKADFDVTDYDGHYGVAVDNCSTWGSVTNCHGRNIYKTITFGASGLSSTAGQAYRGIPRWVSGDNNSMWNGGNPKDNAHGLYEFHSPVQHARLTNSYGADGQEGISFDGGEDLVFEGFQIAGWTRQAIGADGCYRMNGLKVGGGVINRRTLLAAGTRVANGFNAAATAFDVTDANWINDIINDFSPALVQIGDEKIQVGSRNASNGFTGATRAMFGTTAASHLTGDRVYGLGSYEAVPIDLQLYYCKRLLVDPDKFATDLTGAMTNSQNTVPVADLSLFDAATAANPKFAEIEGELSGDGYASEIVSYTGKSAATGAGTLTGVARGQADTNAVSHVQYMQVQQYTCALTNIDIHDMDVETDIGRPCITIYGYNPSENCRLYGVGIKYTGPTPMTEFAAYVQPHGWAFEGAGKKIQGYTYGYRSQGNRQRITNLNACLAVQNTSGGYGALIEGDGSTVFGLETDGLYQSLSIASTADKTRYDAVIGRRTTAALNNAGTNTSAGAAADV